MRKEHQKKYVTLLIAGIFLVPGLLLTTQMVTAGSYNGQDLVNAILVNQTAFISSSYTDRDNLGHRGAIVLSSLGTMHPTQGLTFALLSTGIAGANPVTESAYNPGSERGGFFERGRYNPPYDEATLTITLQVPPYMHYLYYDVQFFSAEYPEYVGTQYNDKFTATVQSPSMGTTQYIIDVNSGDFILNSNHIPGSGFDIFATSGAPDGVDWVQTTPLTHGADAGATAPIKRKNPVSPYETITVTFNIKDIGDNQFDSAVLIDNLVFSGHAQTQIMSRKNVQDLNGGLVECGDTLRYAITISNIGTANQSNNPGNEFEDFIPNNTTYVPGSITASAGTINYESANRKITWNGAIPKESSIAISFDVTVNQSLFNGALISNQGHVLWDSNENHINNAVELTDDPSVDDGIDQDNDGETGDDDPTILTVNAFEAPTMVTEDFSDDFAGQKATQQYESHLWFETSYASGESNFEVAPSYHYYSIDPPVDNAQSFKMKLRAGESPQYWNYTLASLNGNLQAWEAWFTCGNVSEYADLLMNFKNTAGNDIAKLKFQYVHEGTILPADYLLILSYWDPDTGWMMLSSDYLGGYLYNNNWYQIRIEKNGAQNINYSLYRSGYGLVDEAIGKQLPAPFTDFAQVEWSSTQNPVVCPLFFWDIHKVYLN
ncbi:MAG: choice-of-anchor L domain-containing protein [Methanobacteriota archaeon]